ncbi:MAG: hypothetical protein GXO65_01625 [Euryarchaeota archaeon]|nr:hypothetical protein [Euryarchaeota archaeon]
MDVLHELGDDLLGGLQLPVQLHGLLEALDGPVDVPHTLEYVPEAGICLGIVGVDVHRLLEALPGLLQVAQVLPDAAQVEKGHRVLGVYLDGLFVIPDRILELPEVIAHVA